MFYTTLVEAISSCLTGSSFACIVYLWPLFFPFVLPPWFISIHHWIKAILWCSVVYWQERVSQPVVGTWKDTCNIQRGQCYMPGKNITITEKEEKKKKVKASRSTRSSSLMYRNWKRLTSRGCLSQRADSITKQACNGHMLHLIIPFFPSLPLSVRRYDAPGHRA